MSLLLALQILGVIGCVIGLAVIGVIGVALWRGGDEKYRRARDEQNAKN